MHRIQSVGIGLCIALLPMIASAQKRVVHTAERPLPANEAAMTMAVPEGFRVTLFAGEPDVMQPIGFCSDDRGRLWVAEAYNYPEHGTRAGDRIVILEDSDGDGHHDQRTVFYEGLNYVSGIEVGFGGAWVMSPPFMYFIPDRDHDDVPDAEPQVLLDGFGNHANAHNMANGFAWGPDGWLYGTHGRTNWSMIGKPGAKDEDRVRFDGGVYRYHPTRHVWEPFADGTTNPWGIDWNDVGDAFICNCVNPHLFQVIQGAHYEPWRGRESSRYAYQRIDTIADHLHFVGLGNVRNGIGSPAEDAAGGGHAHCGTLIYLADHFPLNYRDQLFTNNIHGRRINNDLLRRSGSGYVGLHGPDLMRSADPWFMGVTLAAGPNGEIYVSDWSDTGECHSTRNTRKTTGRIYRISYLQTKLPTVDLSKKTSRELAKLQTSRNDWLVRHARRLLHERAVDEADMTNVHELLQQVLKSRYPTPQRLRALWTLRVTGGISTPELVQLLSHDDENLRCWAIRLLCEGGDMEADISRRLIELARDDASAKVRLELASALQRFSLPERWDLATELAAHSEDAKDQNLPLMVWYGIEPLIADDVERYCQLAMSASIPRVRENMARRIAESDQAKQGIGLLMAGIPATTAAVHKDVLAGIQLGSEGQRQMSMPEGWNAAFATLQQSSDPTVVDQSMRLAMRFQDTKAIESIRTLAVNSSVDQDRRLSAITALVDQRVGRFDRQLLELLDDEVTRAAALQGLARYKHPQTGTVIIQGYAKYSASQQQQAHQTLATRSEWAEQLLDAMETGVIDPKSVNAMVARQLRQLGDATITKRLARVWGEVRETPKDRAKQITDLKKWLTAENLSGADQERGAATFKKRCAACHRFFGEGGAIGPDLTGAQRTNLDYLLENIVDPSASVAKEFRMEIVQTVDGRVITGLIESANDRTLTIVNALDRHVIPVDEIEQRKQSSESVMPAGLLEGLSEQDIRDLFGYLQR